MPTPTHCEVAVVGAGLAGLACARDLTRAGVDVHVWEASEAVGGRVRTDELAGFRLDRGFQILCTAYPEAQRALDLDRLDLQPFERALLLHVDGITVRLADPLQELSTALHTVRAPVGSLRERGRLGAYAARASVLPIRRLKERSEISARDGWREQGLADNPIERLLRPFFGGVVLETEMTTSRRFVDLMTRMFVRGSSGVPARGMQAIPEQLAGSLPREHLHLGREVLAVAHDRLETAEGETRADAVVVGTDADGAADLLPGIVEPAAWKGVTTLYHAAPESPTSSGTLLVDADSSPVNNTLALTAAAPSYATDGRALVATSLVHSATPGDVDEATVRHRLATLYDCSTSSWEHVATYDVPHALPAMPAPHTFRKRVRLAGPDGPVYLCGDHRDTSSIQGALVSGRRAADAVLTDLRPGATR